MRVVVADVVLVGGRHPGRAVETILSALAGTRRRGRGGGPQSAESLGLMEKRDAGFVCHFWSL